MAKTNSKYQNASKIMRATISLAAFLVVGLAAYWFSRRQVAGRRSMVAPFSFLAALCFTGFGYTLDHHIRAAGLLDRCTVRHLLACTITLLGTMCFVDMTRRIGRAGSRSSSGVRRISHSASGFPSVQRYELAAR